MMMIKDISQPLRACLNFSSGKRKTNISLPANWPRLPVEKHATQKAENELYVFFGKRFRIESRKSVKKALKKRGSTTYRVSQKKLPFWNFLRTNPNDILGPVGPLIWTMLHY